MYKIEKAKLEEFLEINCLLKESWTNLYGQYLSKAILEETFSSWFNQKLFASDIQDKDIYCATAKNDETNIVGLITARRIDNDQTLLIHGLYIIPEYQGKGIGKNLLDKAFSAFEGVTTIFLDVEAINQRAIDFYLKQGFELYDESEETIGNKIFKVIEMVNHLE